MPEKHAPRNPKERENHMARRRRGHRGKRMGKGRGKTAMASPFEKQLVKGRGKSRY